MSLLQPKRRFEKTSSAPAENGYGVWLDEKRLKSPAGGDLTLPTAALAAAIAEEWAAQGEMIEPSRMPMMQLAATALDRAAPQREAITAELLRYSDTDLLVHRAEAPPPLVERQNALWNPPLDWARTTHGLAFTLAFGLNVPPRDELRRARIEAMLGELDLWRFTALQQAVAVSGSFVLGLALVEGAMTPEAVHAAAECDALFQAERWGADAEAEARQKALLADLDAVKRFVDLVS